MLKSHQKRTQYDLRFFHAAILFGIIDEFYQRTDLRTH